MSELGDMARPPRNKNRILWQEVASFVVGLGAIALGLLRLNDLSHHEVLQGAEALILGVKCGLIPAGAVLVALPALIRVKAKK